MHKDHKLKRAERMDIMKRELRQPKTVDRRALEKFKAVPYQLRYKEYRDMVEHHKKEVE